MVEEVREHIALITGWLHTERLTEEEPLDDLDPPNIPG
jgi:hypothetical protein